MTDPPTSTLPDARAAHEPTPKSGSAATAFCTAWFLPATTARRTAGLGLGWAYLVHLIAAVAAVLLVCVLVAWGESTPPVRLVEIVDRLGRLSSQLVRQYERFPGSMIAATASTILGVELGFLLLTALITAWGARDESLRASFVWALRQTWLHTADVLPAILLVGCLSIAYQRAYLAWSRSYSLDRVAHMVQPPSPPGPRATTQTLRDYERQMEEFNRNPQEYFQTFNDRWERAQRQRPAFVNYGGAVIGAACIGSAAWLLWALFRAVGISRATPPIARPPMCETCGYDLTAAAMDGRCPECGEPVAHSLAPEVRPGAIDEACRKRSRLGALGACAMDAIFYPRQFGRRIRLLSPTTEYRVLLAIELPILFVMGGAGMVLCIIAMNRGQLQPDDIETLSIVAPIVGGLTVLFCLFVAVGSASAVGAVHWIREKRNLMSGTIQVAAYASPYFLAWVAFAALTGALGLALDETYRELRRNRALGVDPEALAVIVWLGLNVIWLAGYLWIVACGTAAARYANR